ncbi:uncharacterized protein LOC110892738 [Helianthus annuus]|uniref:uncharacterized protein LOC110892738 n=1 Tax=Helianthus annuus TaxID=4232 RepID=UPI000B8FF9D0|nr:uncharacterized protein LOC110892738 [Helianthus annuus]
MVRQSLAKQIDLNSQSEEFVWNKWASGKSNMFVWRAINDKIPTAITLRERGLTLTDYNCSLCGEAEESANHVLLLCSFAKQVWKSILDWVKCRTISVEGSLKQLIPDVIDLQISRSKRKAIHAIVLQTIWSLWNTRNEKLFRGKPGVIQRTTEDIKEESYQYIKQRSKFNSIQRQQWWDFNFVM